MRPSITTSVSFQQLLPECHRNHSISPTSSSANAAAHLSAPNTRPPLWL